MYQAEGVVNVDVELNHDYDLAGRRTRLGATIHNGVVLGGIADLVNAYQYDPLSRMTTVTQTARGGNAVAPKHVSFTYDLASQLTDVHRYQLATPAASRLVAHSRYEFDFAGRLQSLTHAQEELAPGATWTGTFPSAPAGTLAAYHFSYDAANRLTGMAS